MEDESIKSKTERYFTLLHYTLLSKLPRFTGYNEPHPYAEGTLMSSVTTEQTETGWRINIKAPHSAFALGYKDDGSRRAPRGPHEAYNFTIVDTCIELANKTIGGVNSSVKSK